MPRAKPALTLFGAYRRRALALLPREQHFPCNPKTFDLRKINRQF